MFSVCSVDEFEFQNSPTFGEVTPLTTLNTIVQPDPKMNWFFLWLKENLPKNNTRKTGYNIKKKKKKTRLRFFFFFLRVFSSTLALFQTKIRYFLVPLFTPGIGISYPFLDRFPRIHVRVFKINTNFQTFRPNISTLFETRMVQQSCHLVSYIPKYLI